MKLRSHISRRPIVTAVVGNGKVTHAGEESEEEEREMRVGKDDGGDGWAGGVMVPGRGQGKGKRGRKSGFVSVMSPTIRKRIKEFSNCGRHHADKEFEESLDDDMDDVDDNENKAEDDEEKEKEEAKLDGKYLKYDDGENASLLRLKRVFTKLKEVDNGDATEHPGLNSMCRLLVSKRYLKSVYHCRRLWTCCCLVEVLRIFAPEPPFSAEVLSHVFGTCTRLLAGLRLIDHREFVTLFGLLEQLATIKAYALVANQADECENVFLCFYSLTVERHSIKLQSYLADIMSSLLEEAEVISPLLLSILLSPLTHPASYKDSEAAKALAAIVIASSQNALTTPLSNLLNASLAGETKKQGQDTLDCDLSSLLVHLNRIAPDLLIHVIPNLESDARHTSVSHRLRCVTILSQLFSSSKRMVSAYPTLYTEYLDRSIDIDPNIRACVTATLGTLLTYAAQDAPRSEDVRRQYLSKRLRERLLDADERVRATAVSAAGQVFQLMGPKLKEAFTSRLKDKKSRVRCATLDAMILARGADSEGWIPYTMLQCYPTLGRIGDYKATELIERAIFHRFIPWNEDARDRTRAFVRIASACDKRTLQTLTSMIRRRAVTRLALMELVQTRLSSSKKEYGVGKFQVDHAAATFGRRESISTNTKDSLKPSAWKKFADLVGPLSQHHAFLKDDPAEKLIKSLINVVDLKVLKSLQSALDLRSSVSTIKKAEADVISRLASQENVQKFVQKVVFVKAAPFIFTNEHVLELLSLGKPASDSLDSAEKVEKESDQLKAVLVVLDILSVAMVDALKIGEDQIIDMVTSSEYSTEAQTTGLQVLSRLGARKLDTGLKRELCAWISGTNSPPENAFINAKWATRSLIKIHESSKGHIDKLDWDEITTDLSDRLDDFGGDFSKLVAPLMSLAQLAKFAPKIFKKVSLQSYDFARSLLSGSFNPQISSHRASKLSPPKQGKKKSRSPSKKDLDPSSLDKPASDAVKAATKILVNSLPFVDAADELPLTIETLANILRTSGDVFERYSDDGKGQEARCDDVTCGFMRLASSLAILRLARNPAYFQKLPPSTFLTCLLTAQDPLADIRLSFVSKIHSMILYKRLPFRWVTGLALMAVDPDRDNFNAVRELMTSLIRRRRYVIRNWTSNSQITHMLPEAELPVLLWVVANHPDAADDVASGCEESSKYIEFFLDRLLDAHDYAGVLSQKLQAVSMSSDAVSQSPGSSERLAVLARLGGSVLQKKQAGRRWNLDKIPGDVCLPADLFRMPKHLEDQGRNLLAVAKNFDARQEDTSTTPVKRTPRGMRKRGAEGFGSAHYTPRTPASKTQRRRYADPTPRSSTIRVSTGKKRQRSSRPLNMGLDVDVTSTMRVEKNENSDKENQTPPKRLRGTKQAVSRTRKRTSMKSPGMEKPKAPLRRSARNRKASN